MLTPIIERTTGDKILRAAVVSLDALSQQQRKRAALERVGLSEFGAFPSTAQEFKTACDVNVDLLVIASHGGKRHDDVGFGRHEWLNIEEVKGFARTLLVLTCYGGDGDHPALWKRQFSANHIVAATGEPEALSGYNAALRVLREPSLWTAPDEICARFRNNMGAPVLAAAGWIVS